VLAATLGVPPENRPVQEIAPGLAYYPHHTGFDFRRLRSQLAERFDVEDAVCSPVPWLVAWCNSEIVFLARKQSGDRGQESGVRGQESGERSRHRPPAS
jgi:hypothetical protein